MEIYESIYDTIKGKRVYIRISSDSIVKGIVTDYYKDEQIISITLPPYKKKLYVPLSSIETMEEVE